MSRPPDLLRLRIAQLMAWLRMQRERWRIRSACGRARWALRTDPALRAGITAEGRRAYEDFRRLSVNRANLLRLQLSTTLLPRNLRELLLAYLASGERTSALSSWVHETLCDAPDLLWRPTAWRSERVVEAEDFQLWLHRPEGLCSAGRESRLVVCFSSNANGIGVSTPALLQMLHPLDADVAIILRSRPRSDGFLKGALASGSLRDSMVCRICEALADAVPDHRQRRVATLGYSGGGFSAAIGALLLGAEAGISLGGRPPLRWGQVVDRSAFDDTSTKRLLFCCCGGFAPDVEGARRSVEALEGCLPAGVRLEARAYEGCSSHNLVMELQRRGYPVRAVLADLLFPAPPPLPPHHRWGRPVRYRLLH